MVIQDAGLLEIEQQQEAETQEALETLWIVTLGDMMTTLTIFFLVLYALNYAVYLKVKDNVVDKKMIEIQEKLKQYTKIQLDRNEVRLQLPESVMFDIGSAELKPMAKDVLKKIASVLTTTNDLIVVEGHTDNYPIIHSSRYRSNWHLSCARAFNVVQYLIEFEKIPPERISGWGFAEYRPIASFDTMEDRAKNRRIELVLLHEQIVE